jgi:hypothetical protein
MEAMKKERRPERDEASDSNRTVAAHWRRDGGSGTWHASTSDRRIAGTVHPSKYPYDDALAHLAAARLRWHPPPHRADQPLTAQSSMARQQITLRVHTLPYICALSSAVWWERDYYDECDVCNTPGDGEEIYSD